MIIHFHIKSDSSIYLNYERGGYCYRNIRFCTTANDLNGIYFCGFFFFIYFLKFYYANSTQSNLLTMALHVYVNNTCCYSIMNHNCCFSKHMLKFINTPAVEQPVVIFIIYGDKSCLCQYLTVHQFGKTNHLSVERHTVCRSLEAWMPRDDQIVWLHMFCNLMKNIFV